MRQTFGTLAAAAGMALALLGGISCSSDGTDMESVPGTVPPSTIQAPNPRGPAGLICPDADGDGFRDSRCGGGDCDDRDPGVNPEARDTCGDGIDNDCDDIVDNPKDPAVELPEFIFGACKGIDEAGEILEELGVRWARLNIPWKAVMPEVESPLLTLRVVMEHPEIVERLIEETDWSEIDGWAYQMLDRGITPIPVVGHGYDSNHAMIEGDKATPDRLGREEYLGQMYLHVRAIVERYDGDGELDAEGIVVNLWQIENELNQALLTAAWGWREPSWLDALHSAWADWDFLTRLLWALQRAVKDADPEALTTMNFHTDVHPNISHLLGQPSWIEAVTLWRELMDIVGFDAYPNYYISEPILGEMVGELVEIIDRAGCGKPVFAVEVDYPTGPAQRGFTPEHQAEFLDAAFHSAYEAGAVGYLKLSVTGPDHTSVSISDQDLRNMEMVGTWWGEGNVLPMLAWAILNLDYVEGHFLDVVKSVEGFWGVVTPEGDPKPAYHVMEDIVRELAEDRDGRTP